MKYTMIKITTDTRDKAKQAASTRGQKLQFYVDEVVRKESEKILAKSDRNPHVHGSMRAVVNGIGGGL